MSPLIPSESPFLAAEQWIESLRRVQAARERSKSLSKTIRKSLLLLSNRAQWESLSDARLMIILRTKTLSGLRKSTEDKHRLFLVASISAKFCFVKSVGFLLRCSRLVFGLIGVLLLRVSRVAEQVLLFRPVNVDPPPLLLPAVTQRNPANSLECKYPPSLVSLVASIPEVHRPET